MCQSVLVNKQKALKAFSAQVFEAFNSNSSRELLPRNSHRLTRDCWQLQRPLYQPVFYGVIAVRHSHGTAQERCRRNQLGVGPVLE